MADLHPVEANCGTYDVSTEGSGFLVNLLNGTAYVYVGKSGTGALVNWNTYGELASDSVRSTIPRTALVNGF